MMAAVSVPGTGVAILAGGASGRGEAALLMAPGEGADLPTEAATATGLTEASFAALSAVGLAPVSWAGGSSASALFPLRSRGWYKGMGARGCLLPVPLSSNSPLLVPAGWGSDLLLSAGACCCASCASMLG